MSAYNNPKKYNKCIYKITTMYFFFVWGQLLGSNLLSQYLFVSFHNFSKCIFFTVYTIQLFCVNTVYISRKLFLSDYFKNIYIFTRTSNSEPHPYPSHLWSWSCSFGWITVFLHCQEIQVSLELIYKNKIHFSDIYIYIYIYNILKNNTHFEMKMMYN